MKRQIRRVSAYLSLPLVITVCLVGSGLGWAQDKHKIQFVNLPKNTTFNKQYRLKAGDVPGHYVRIFEIHRRYPHDPPKFNGVSVTEQWDRGYSDYTDTNGRAWWYITYFLENGDKIYAREDGTSTTQTKQGSSDSSISKFAGVITITGGTGKFKGIRGLLQSRISFNPETGFSIGKHTGEYWFEK
jgi:hypothetical protein